MAVTELHFFHGFLGDSSDWLATRECLSEEGRLFFAHRLGEDFVELSGEDYFKQWAQFKEKQISNSKNKKILIGYSLGGRLALHLNSGVFDALLLLGAHPGLQEGREGRLATDQDWVKKAEYQTMAEWLRDWNGQEVFSQDRYRPQRDWSEEEFSVQLQMLLRWSLAKQEVRDPWIAENSRKVYWACGELDCKFQALRMRMAHLLREDHVFTVPEAGHGVLFDQPQYLATVIEKVIDDVR